MIEVLLMAMLAPEPAAVVQDASSKPAAVSDVVPDDEKEICRRKFDNSNSDGHMLKSRKVCKTAAEWAEANKRL